jgi:hypothetical protein
VFFVRGSLNERYFGVLNVVAFSERFFNRQ